MEGSWNLFIFICKAGWHPTFPALIPSPYSPFFFFSLFYPPSFQQGQEAEVPILGAAQLLKGERISSVRPIREAGCLIINPSSCIPWLPTKGTIQIDPTKWSVLISQPLPNAVPFLASTWKSLLSHHIPSSPCPPPPALSLLSFSVSQGVTTQASRKESNRDRSYYSAKRQEKKIIKKAGDLEKTRIISQIEWENLTCLITTENKHCANAQASDWHAGCFE